MTKKQAKIEAARAEARAQGAFEFFASAVVLGTMVIALLAL